MRTIVRILSTIGIVLSLLALMLLGTVFRLSITEAIIAATPLIYFTYCLASAFGSWSFCTLLIGGSCAHLLMIPYLYFVFRIEIPLPGVPILVMALFWAAMFYESTFDPMNPR